MASKMGPYKKILVPVDGSRTSALGLKEALRIARSGRGKLRLIHVVDMMVAVGDPALTFTASDILGMLTEEGKKVLARAKAAVSKAGIKAETRLIESGAGRVADRIVSDARRWRADLIVMGTHGRRGISHLVLGSDAELVIRATTVPVLLVRGPRLVKRKSPNRR